jgi:hypothetical protein
VPSKLRNENRAVNSGRRLPVRFRDRLRPLYAKISTPGDPFRVLEQAAQRTDEAIVVVEPLILDLVNQGSVVRWNPAGGANATGWWNLTPGAFVAMLEDLGSPHTTVTCHQHPYRAEGGHDPVDVPSFTVLARR